MEINEIKKLMCYLEERELKKIVIKKGDFELHLEKNSPNDAAAPISTFVPVETKGQATQVVAQKEETTKKEGQFVTSPMVGTFYGSPSPEQGAFVKVGDRVEEDTVVCIVEAMKVMNEVKAGKKGMIAEILIENAQPVEYGTNLFRVV